MQTITITTDKGETIQVKGEIIVDGKPLTQPVKEKQYPWEKSFTRVCVGKKVFYVENGSRIIETNLMFSNTYAAHKNVVPAESIALSVLAYTQLKVIITDMNGTAEMLTPEMNGGRVWFLFYNYDTKTFDVDSRSFTCVSPFAMRTRALCQQLIDENTELLEQFYEIKK